MEKVNVEIKIDTSIRPALENIYLSVVTSLAMLRSFAGSTARFRNNYEETFKMAELNYMEANNATQADAVKWTEEQLAIYFANLQHVLYEVAVAMRSTNLVDEDTINESAFDRSILFDIDGFIHDDDGTSSAQVIEFPEEMQKQINEIFKNIPNN